eukprot:6202505-Pleurochrysis_carterae.AAC.1
MSTVCFPSFTFYCFAGEARVHSGRDHPASKFCSNFQATSCRTCTACRCLVRLDWVLTRRD